jgi:hypothetical protein
MGWRVGVGRGGGRVQLVETDGGLVYIKTYQALGTNSYNWVYFANNF